MALGRLRPVKLSFYPLKSTVLTLDGELTLENSAEGFSATLRLPVVLEAQLTQPR